MVLGMRQDRALLYKVVCHGVGYGAGLSIRVSSCTAWCLGWGKTEHYGIKMYCMVLGMEQHRGIWYKFVQFIRTIMVKVMVMHFRLKN